MKTKLFKLLTLIVCIPAILVCGCSKKRSNFDKFDASAYLESKVTYITYDNSNNQTMEINEFFNEEVDPVDVKNYSTIKITAKSAWVYKMYIDKIYFNFYSNKSLSTELIVNLTITNLAPENDLSKPESKSFTCSFIPKENESILCEFEIEKIVANATGCLITIDINESIDSEFIESDFRWTIYNFEIYGEHKTY